MTDCTVHAKRRGHAPIVSRWLVAALVLSLGVAAAPLTRAAATVGAPGGHLDALRLARHPAPTRTAPLPSPRGVPTGRVAAGARDRSWRRAPRAAGPAATFVVNSLSDSPLASAASKRCADAEASHRCSLRAAVQAANNLNRPVLVKLSSATYTLGDAALGALSVTNAGGTSIVGTGQGTTKVVVPAGKSYGVLFLGDAASGAGATLYLTGLSLNGGHAATGGGLQVAPDSNLAAILDRVTIAGNHAVSDGGGVFVKYASLWATDSSISNNVAGASGGGLYNYWGNLYLTDDQVNGNAALNNAGGGLYQEYGSTRVAGGSISHDAAGTIIQLGEGGGIYDAYGAVTLSGGAAVSYDTVYNDGAGGGEYEYEGSLVASHATFSYDKAIGGADASGGALAVELSAHVTLNAVTMSHDSTTASNGSFGGGAIFDYGFQMGDTLAIGQGSSFLDNATGAIFLKTQDGGLAATISDTLLKGNVASIQSSGAAVRLLSTQNGGITLSMLHDQVLSNTDTGPFSAGGVESYASVNATVDVHLDGDTVVGNVATGSQGTGGVQSFSDQHSSSPLEILNSLLAGNHAPDGGFGGAVSDASNNNFDNAALTLVNDVLSHNSAGSAVAGRQGYGGAVAAENYAAVTMTGCTVTDNTATGTGGAGGNGGGVYDASYLGTQFVSDTVTGNRATGKDAEGGGIWTTPYDGGGLLERSTVSSNFADRGAGLYVNEYTMDIQGSTIARNVAGGGGVGGEGAGVYEFDSTLNVENSTIADNLAQSAGSIRGLGGGVYASSGSAITLYFTTLSGNASARGAGIYSLLGSGTIRDSIVADNHTTLTGKTQADCFAAGRYEFFASAGGNVLSLASCVVALSFGDVVTARPGLLALGANGGPTRTMALTARSPARNAAHGDCPAADQRGVARPKNGACDSGAYQHAAKKR